VTGARNDISGHVTGVVVQSGHIDTVALPAAVPAALAGLPAEEGFSGRAAELAVLADVLAEEGRTTVATVAGPPGVGKSALVIRAAHSALANGWFPGGVLFADLHGYDPARRVEANTALAALLRALGVRGEHIPAEQGERETLYRSELAALARTGRRVLVVADNAADADQVHPLRPGDPAHRLLVTSRHTLPISSARRVEVDVLPPADAVTVLDDALRAANPADTRITDDPAAAATLAALCGHLPLALRITAQVLADQPDDPITDLVGVFSNAHTRLGELTYGDSVAIQVAFDASYSRLPADQARLFRLLALHPGPHIERDVASALAGVPTRHLLDGLRRAHLIHPARGIGRYTWHDLLLLYAADHCERLESPADRTAAIERLLDCYRTTIAAANTWIDAARTPESGRFTDPAAALAWLDAERPNLVAVVLLAAGTGHDTHVLDIGAAVYPFLEMRNLRAESVAIAERGIEAAQCVGDQHRKAHCLARLGITFRHLRRYDDSIARLTEALAIQQDIGDRGDAGNTLNSLGATYREVRRLGDAETCLREGLDLCLETGDRLGQAISLNTLANVHRDARRFEQALEHYQRALVVRREMGDRYGEAISLNNLANAFHTLRRTDEATEHYRLALAIRRETGDKQGEGISLNDLGRVCRHVGQHDEAIGYFQQALDVQRDANDRQGTARTLTNLAHLYADLGRTDHAVDTFVQALEVHREIGDRYGQGCVLDGLANTYRTAGRYTEAVDCLRQALELRRSTGDTFRLPITLTGLGITYRSMHKFDEAVVVLVDALAVRVEIGDVYGEAITLAELGMTYHCLGRYDEAQDHYQRAIARFERTSAPDEAKPVVALLARLAEDKASDTITLQPELEAKQAADQRAGGR
jgi:tetratricopeptide (TPR) repeat protein